MTSEFTNFFLKFVEAKKNGESRDFMTWRKEVTTGLDCIMLLNEVCQFHSTERPPEKASKSELRRLLDQSAFRINGKIVKSKDVIEFPITSVVLFPKSETKRITIL